MSRIEVTEKIVSTKVSKGLKWEDVAKKVGKSKEWTTALCLGQMTATPEQAAERVVRALEDRPLTVNVAVGSVAEVLNLVAPRLTDLVHFRLGRRFPDSPAATRHRETEADRADAG